MLELGLMVVVIAGAALAIGKLQRSPATNAFDEDPVDLPCPWCRAQTREDDLACPSCHHPFGEPADR